MQAFDISKNKISQFFVLIFLTLLLNACGFHLRGHEPLPPQLNTLSIESSAPYSPLVKTLTETLKASHVEIISGKQLAPVTLQILTDNFSSQSSSVGASGQVTTYVLLYTVGFQLLDRSGKSITGPLTVTTTRNYSVSANQIVGDTNVQSTLKEEMQRDIIYQILNRLRSREVVRALSTVQSPA